ncbi:protein kinase domain-containing protein [Diaphorobacter sp.]|uniref:protein kinase domain-containing protein n=1 Tax=Diaphorobacter sp. TaxID=1934310 RepID=UPI0028AC0A38|nr:protein kinase [Diaphorobacter sp.]
MSDIPGFRTYSNIHHMDALPVGARLGEFEIVALLGVGGFGMVYQAFDHSLLRFVAIKEYMPAALAGRAQGRSVWVRSQSDESSFKVGLSSFVEEARLLAQFDHPSLVKVFRFWEDNHTAYMVMPLYTGMTLKQARTHMRTPPSEEWLRKVIWSVCGALQVLHEGKTLHRDISPDNIFLQDVGPPVLLDLGAARYAISESDRRHTAVLKVNYAPIEQYADSDSDLKPGPWSDIYSLAAVVYGCVCNDVPLPSTLRSIRDRMVPFRRVARTVRKQFGVEYSQPLVDTIGKALSLQPRDRHWSTEAFLEHLEMTDAPAQLERFDFRAELGEIWMETPDQNPVRDAGLEESGMSAPVETAPASASVPDLALTVTHSAPLAAAVAAPAPLGRQRAGESADFQDTVVRDPDFDDSRMEPFDSVLAEPKKSAAIGTTKAKKRASAKGGQSAAHARKRRFHHILWASGLVLVLLVLGAVWQLASDAEVAPAQAQAQTQAPAFAPTPDDEILTELADDTSIAMPESAASEEAAAAMLAATGASEDAVPAEIPAFVVAKEPKPKAQPPVRKPGGEAPAMAAPVETPAPVALVAQPAAATTKPAVIRRASPEEICASASFLARPMCIHNQCQNPGMEGYPSCIDSKRRREEERRQRQMYTQ